MTMAKHGIQRRTYVIGLGAAALAGCATTAPPQNTYVLVHGGWHGGWEWEQVVPMLRAKGARVYAPTLKGLAERQSENGPDVTLDTHIQEVIDLIKTNNLNGITLVGHSYSGFVVSGVCDRVPNRIAKVVFLDAFVPDDGQSVMDFVEPPSRVEAMRQDILTKGQGYKSSSPPASQWGLSGEQAAMVNKRTTPQPARTYDQPIRLTRGGAYAVPERVYIDCADPAMPPFVKLKARLKEDKRWKFISIPAGHEVAISNPTLLADTLMSIR